MKCDPMFVTIIWFLPLSLQRLQNHSTAVRLTEDVDKGGRRKHILISEIHAQPSCIFLFCFFGFFLNKAKEKWWYSLSIARKLCSDKSLGPGDGNEP